MADVNLGDGFERLDSIATFVVDDGPIVRQMSCATSRQRGQLPPGGSIGELTQVPNSGRRAASCDCKRWMIDECI